ncbi:hypothetical protein ACPESR_13670 [Nocardia testacea]|uniref:hypothetical protein n=1 Tax=Nocardia testacea TaxID=248551 RepID=UPI003C2EBEB3
MHCHPAGLPAGCTPNRRRANPAALPGDAEFLLCGPTTFLHTVRGTLLEQGIPSGRIRTEQFVPTDWRENAA